MSRIRLRTATVGMVSILALFAVAALVGWRTEQLGGPALGIISVVCIAHAIAVVRFWDREAERQGGSGSHGDGFRAGPRSHRGRFGGRPQSR